jgi:hypothetical protein
VTPGVEPLSITHACYSVTRSPHVKLRVNTYRTVAGRAVLGVAAPAPKRVRPWVLGAALAGEVYVLGAMSRNGRGDQVLTSSEISCGGSTPR